MNDSTIGGDYVARDKNIFGDEVKGDKKVYQVAPREVTFPIDNLPPENRHFVGRADQLRRLADGGASAGSATGVSVGSAATRPTTITQAIAGLGGVGKSQLMLHFAHQQRDNYDLIWWLRVDEALAEDFIALGRQLGLAVMGLDQAAAVQQVRSWLNSTDKSWLLLFDNADEMKPRDLRQLLPSNPKGRILITSRNSGWQSVGQVVRLDVFAVGEAAEFWRERLGPASTGSASTGSASARVELAEEPRAELAEEPRAELAEEPRAELAEALGHLPLALEHAAAYMATNGLDAPAYLALYRARRRELWEYTPQLDDYHATITTTWEIGFEAARQTPGAAELLNLCCFLAPDDIPLNLLVEYAAIFPTEAEPVEAEPVEAEPVEAEPVEAEPAEAPVAEPVEAEAGPATLAAVLTDDLARNAALNALGRYSLLVRADGMLSIHRLVQAVARDRMGPERAKKWVETAVDFLHDAYTFDPHDMTTWAACGQLMPHLAAATELADEMEHLTNRAAYLNNETGFYLQQFGNLAGARPYYERALAIREQALGADHPDTATSLNDLGSLLQGMGDLAGAKPYKERALAIYEKALGPDHPWTATSLNNLGGLLQGMGDLAGARPYYERALAIRERVLGAEHPDTAQSLNNLGYLLQAMDDLAGARPYYERALAIFEAKLGPEHPNPKIVRRNLASINE